MIMKSNLGKMLGRMAPQQGAGMTVQPQQPQLGGGLMAGLNKPNPPGGMTSSDMIGTLGRMLGGRRPMRPTNTGEGIVVQPAIPQPYQEEIIDGGMRPLPYNPVNTTTEEDMRGRPGSGMGIGGILNSLRGMQPGMPQQPMGVGMPSVDPNVPYRPTGPDAFYGPVAPPSFDRNAALQAFNARAGEANKMFTSGLFGTGGVSPDEFRSYQTKLRDLQLDTGSTPQQHEAALNEAMAYMNRVAPRPVELPRAIPQGMGQVSGVGNAAPAFDPNRALQELNAQLGRIHKGGGQLDMNFVRDQQARLRDLQVNRDATPEQHDAAYRNAMAELRARYPDAFAG